MRRKPSRRRSAGRKPASSVANPANPERVQYTVRNVPRKADEALRRRAGDLRVSLNEILRQALMKEAGMVGSEIRTYDDLDAFVGSWQEDPEFEAIIAEQDRVDPEKWA